MDLNSHGVVALVRNTEGKFLLLEDAREPTKGLWAPPHGRCEPSDQSEESSVTREVKEETCLEATPIKKLHTQAADTKVKTVSFWLVETTNTEIRLDAESSNYAWVTIDEALSMNLYPGTKTFFEKVKANEITIGQ